MDDVNTNHKAELIVVDRIEVVLHNLGLELHVGAGHEVHPDVGVALPDEAGLFKFPALHHRRMKLLSFRLITNLENACQSGSFNENKTKYFGLRQYDE